MDKCFCKMENLKFNIFVYKNVKYEEVDVLFVGFNLICGVIEEVMMCLE